MERTIIDVSKHQGIIDWSKVKGNVDGAIIRCGYGSDLASQDDSQFKANVDGCIANGIPFGVYLYSYAKALDAAKSEAAHVLRLVEPYKDKLSYPVYLDLEESGTESGAVERAIAFGDLIEAAGYSCGIYANQNWWQNYLKDGLDRFTKWIARYSTKKPEGISGTYDIWQYSSTGTVSGISGNVDMNICYRDFPSEITSSSTTKDKTSSTSAAKAPIYKVGAVYTTQVELKVRTGAGTNYRAKTYSELSANAKANDSDKDGAINKGTKVTCKALKTVGNDIWMQIPSGWIAAYYSGKKYVK